MLAFATVFVAMGIGQDANWDLRNYHAYNPFALLTGRYGFDLMPAQMQTWHNPLVDVPFHLLATAPISGRWATAWLALPTALALWFSLRLLDRTSPRPPSLLAEVQCALLAGTGAAGWCTFATTFNEWPNALAAVAAAALVLGALGDERPHGRPIFAAGFVLGVAVGLKATAIAYALGLVPFSVVAAPPGARLRSLRLIALGGVLGGLLTIGWWSVVLWEVTGSPTFPYFNAWFRSPLTEPAVHGFDAFQARAWRHSLLAPWWLARGGRFMSELPLRDPRLLLGFATVLVAVPWILRRSRAGASSLADRRLLALLVYFVASTAFWIWGFSVYRYAVGLECLVAVAVVSTVSRIPKRAGRVAALLALCAVHALTLRPSFGRTEFTTPFLDTRHPDYSPGTVLVILGGEPLGYAVVGVPRDVPVLSLNNNLMGPHRRTPWIDDALRTIAEAERVFLILPKPEPDARERESILAYGFAEPSDCRRVPSTLGAFYSCSTRLEPSSPEDGTDATVP